MKKKKNKQKTVKALQKRFKLTSPGNKSGKRKASKVTRMTSGQNHFNANESGKTTRNKRKDKHVTVKKQERLIKTLIK